MITVKLEGFLGEKYGTQFNLAINSVGECIHALSANFKEFKKDVIHEKFYVFVDNISIGLNEAIHAIGGKEIRIVPLVYGGGGKFFKILTGAVLIAASFAIGGPFAGFTASFLFGTGVALVLGGISELLFAPKDARDEEQDKNSGFGGPVNNTRQGSGVPIAYGKILTGSSVISAGLSS